MPVHRRRTRHFLPAAGARRRSGPGAISRARCASARGHLDLRSAQVGAALSSVRPTASAACPRLGKDQGRAGGGGSARSVGAAGHGQGGGAAGSGWTGRLGAHQRRGAGIPPRCCSTLPISACRSSKAGECRKFPASARSIRCRDIRIGTVGRALPGVEVWITRTASFCSGRHW